LPAADPARRRVKEKIEMGANGLFFMVQGPARVKKIPITSHFCGVQVCHQVEAYGCGLEVVCLLPSRWSRGWYTQWTCLVNLVAFYLMSIAQQPTALVHTTRSVLWFGIFNYHLPNTAPSMHLNTPRPASSTPLQHPMGIHTHFLKTPIFQTFNLFAFSFLVNF
jgi:hypothetical protein